MTVAQETERKKGLSPEAQAEVRMFKDYLAKVRSGEMDPKLFQKFRLNNGVYGIRNEDTLHMIRIKCPHGKIDADQLDVVADMAEKFTRHKIGHITTRQAIQLHHIPVDNVAEILEKINEVGLTSREACGNTVRNVTCTPYAGLLADEAFDVTPYADALFRHYLRNPIAQNFSRKFKIALYGGGEFDVAYTAIHDIGLVAKKKVIDGKEVKGFEIYLGGGLGATPHLAIKLEDFTPLSKLFPTCDAVVHIFDRFGNRNDKFHARLKFVVKKFGDEKFREMILQERDLVHATRPGSVGWVLPDENPITPPPAPRDVDVSQKPLEGFELWRRTNVMEQKQAGYSVVTVVTPLGDMTVKQMRDLSNLARKYNGGLLRTMVQQNMVLPFIKNEHLVALHQDLAKSELATPGALRLSDITRCPGADTCQIAVTKSRGLASAVGDIFKNGLAKDLDMKDLSIKISGCTNSCGQHHIGNIGFFGTYRKVNGKEVPHYQLLLGGDIGEGRAAFGKPIAAVPAKRAPELVKRLIELYKEEKKEGERFVETMARLDRARLKKEVEPFQSLPAFEENPDLYYEWGEFQEFKASIGQGECAA